MIHMHIKHLSSN